MINPYIPGFLLSVLLHIGVFFFVVESQQNTIESKQADVVPVSFIVAAAPQPEQIVSEPINPAPTIVTKIQTNEVAKQNELKKQAKENKTTPPKPAEKLVSKKPEKKIRKVKKVKEKPVEKKTKKAATDKTLDAMIRNLEKNNNVQKEPVKKANAPVRKEKPKQVKGGLPKAMPKRKVAMTNQPQLEQSFKQRLQKLIAKNKKYPARAKRNGEEGRVQVSFVIYANGQIKNIQVAKSSGTTSLDQAATKLLRKVSGQLTFPNNMQKKQWQLSLPIEYRLR